MMETTDKTFHSFWQHGILGIVTSLDFLARGRTKLIRTGSHYL